jgi:hypothetical protein
MIKILEQGQQTFTITCDRCGCKFQYDLSDLSGLDYINCPFCHTTLTHRGPKTVKMNLIKDNKTVGDAGYNYATTTGQYVNPNIVTTIGDINKHGSGCVTGKVDIYANKLPDDIIDDQYNNVGMTLPNDIKDNCCYESDDYKAWYEKWCKGIREREPVKCNK